MHQTPAAILVLSSAIFAYGAALHPADALGLALGLPALLLGLWGGGALASASLAERDGRIRREMTGEVPPAGRPAPAETVGLRIAAVDDYESLPPTTDVRDERLAQPAAEGRSAQRDVVDDLLRHHLPAYSRRAA